MADDKQIGPDVLREGAVAEAPAAPLTGASLPVPRDPGLLGYGKGLLISIYRPYYNKFRLVGYLAQTQYSGVLRSVTSRLERSRWGDWLKGNNYMQGESHHPRFRDMDWHDAPRMLLNIGEAIFFFIPALLDHIHERREMRQSAGAMVAAEFGKDKNEISSSDIRLSDNPLLQTNVDRYKSLLMLRYFQPLSFLYNLRVGIAVTVFQIIAERSAFFEKNAFEQLQRIVKEVGNNEWGTWSHDSLVSRFVQIVQQNRAEHKAAPITTREMEQYIPLLGKVAKHVMDKDWRFAETLYVLGELVKDPGKPHKVWHALEQVETIGLEGIARQRRQGLHSSEPKPAVPVPVAAPSPAAPETPGAPNFVRDIMDRGPRPASPEAIKAELGNSNQVTAQR